jgi:hypothetical protein
VFDGSVARVGLNDETPRAGRPGPPGAGFLDRGEAALLHTADRELTDEGCYALAMGAGA